MAARQEARNARCVASSPSQSAIGVVKRNYALNVANRIENAYLSGTKSSAGSRIATVWIVDAHRDNGKRFVVRSDEMLSAFLELERITHELAVSALLGDDSN